MIITSYRLNIKYAFDLICCINLRKNRLSQRNASKHVNLLIKKQNNATYDKD